MLSNVESQRKSIEMLNKSSIFNSSQPHSKLVKINEKSSQSHLNDSRVVSKEISFTFADDAAAASTCRPHAPDVVAASGTPESKLSFARQVRASNLNQSSAINF